MPVGSIPPAGAGQFGGFQGPGEIPQQAKDDANQMTIAYTKLDRLFAQYLEETDPAKKQALEKQIQALLGRIESLCSDLVSIKPPLPSDILSKVDDTAGRVKGILENIEQGTPADFIKLGLQIAALQHLINP